MNDNDLDILIQEKLENLDEIVPAVALATAYTAAGLGFMLTNIYKTFLSKMARACDAYSGSAKTICNIKFKIKASNQVISKAKSEKSKCNKSKNPDKCNDKIDSLVDKHKLKIKNLQNQLNDLKNFTLK